MNLTVRLSMIVMSIAWGFSLHADTFGSGANTFTLEFVEVGNAGNGNDAGAGGGSYSSPYGGVGYDYQISKYEISQNDITKATASGLSNVTAGAHTGDRPAADISWYEAAAFVNWMNTSNGYQAAYDLTYSAGWDMALWDPSDQATTGVDSGTNPYRHKDAFYFLPSEDEWYKAAYHQNDGVTANYWDYATGSNIAPSQVATGTGIDTAVFGGQTAPADVTQTGGLSEYGTMGQNGNVWERIESSFDGLNSMDDENRMIRGGGWNDSATFLQSSTRFDSPSPVGYPHIGFRVASIPEPSSIIFVALSLLACGCFAFKRLK